MNKLAAVVAFALLAVCSAAQAQLPAPADARKIELRWGVRIPLSDGVQLRAVAYLPKGQTAPAPCIVTLTPYTMQAYHDRGAYFAARGLPFVVVDVRGRGNSDGEFRPLIQEGDDGAQVVEWLAKQPYCNGKVAMWGGSYAGYNQWMTASRRPPHLASIAPAASPYMGVDFPARGNIRPTGLLRGGVWTSGRTVQLSLFGDNAFWSQHFRERFEQGRSFASIGDDFGDPEAIALPLAEWLKHPDLDAYWDQYTPTPEQFAQIDVPILSITGVYDADQPGSLAFYRQHMRYASPQARARQFLIIGPWDHAGTRTPRAKVGGLDVGPAGLLDLPQLHTEWYAWTLAGGPRPEFLRKQVAYYVMGADIWRYADSLDAVTAVSQPYFLSSNGDANHLATPGALAATAGRGPADRYVTDPRDTRLGALEAQVDPSDLTDTQLLKARDGGQLVYETAPFQAPTEISGAFRLETWLAIDTPDTDIQVFVYEVDPQGGSILLATDLKRARYRLGLQKAQLISTRQPLRYDFDSFTFISRQVKAGSRLRLVVAPLNSANWEKNYNSGGEVAFETLADARTATVRLFHDRAHPSALYVPFGQPLSK